jgi:hypothetical protein
MISLGRRAWAERRSRRARGAAGRVCGEPGECRILELRTPHRTRERPRPARDRLPPLPHPWKGNSDAPTARIHSASRHAGRADSCVPRRVLRERTLGLDQLAATRAAAPVASAGVQDFAQCFGRRSTGAASDQSDGASGNPAERGDERLARLVEACEITGVPPSTGMKLVRRGHAMATGSTIDPVAPRMASGSATNRNSRTPTAASPSRSRLSSR